MLLSCRALFLVTSVYLTLIKPALDLSIEHSTDEMDQVNFEFSTKNIPIPSEKEFIVELNKTNQMESFSLPKP